jgi:hypothetical protein
LNNKTIRILAALIIAAMFVIVPTTWGLNGSPMGFRYQFIWNIGMDGQTSMPSTPSPAYLIAQIIGVLAITWLLTRDRH